MAFRSTKRSHRASPAPNPSQTRRSQIGRSGRRQWTLNPLSTALTVTIILFILVRFFVLFRKRACIDTWAKDPSVGVKLGYGGLIFHGLLVYAIAARSLLHNLAGGDTTAFVAMSAGFSGPVTPGGELSTSHMILVWCFPLTRRR